MSFIFQPRNFDPRRWVDAMARATETALHYGEVFEYNFCQDREGVITIRVEMGELTALTSGVEGVLIRMGGELVEEVRP